MDGALNGDTGALLVIVAIMYLGWRVNWEIPGMPTRAQKPGISIDMPSPTAEHEIDPTRWKTGGYQPITQQDGNRAPIPDPYVEWEVLPAVGGATALPPAEGLHAKVVTKALTKATKSYNRTM